MRTPRYRAGSKGRTGDGSDGFERANGRAGPTPELAGSAKADATVSIAMRGTAAVIASLRISSRKNSSRRACKGAIRGPQCAKIEPCGQGTHLSRGNGPPDLPPFHEVGSSRCASVKDTMRVRAAALLALATIAGVARAFSFQPALFPAVGLPRSGSGAVRPLTNRFSPLRTAQPL